MNYIVLEGFSLYLFLVLVLILLIISLCCLICVVLSDKRLFILNNLLSRKNREIKELNRENLILKIKCGELDIDENK